MAAPIIGAVIPLKADPRVVRVMVRSGPDGRTLEAARMGIAQWAALKAKPGDRWTPALDAKAERMRTEMETRVAALRLLARSSMSADALRTRLLKRRHSAAAVGRAIRALKADGWLDR